MPLKNEAIEEPALNLTPMIDIVFLLIIFFLVGAEFSKKQAQAEGHYQIELPTVADVEPLTELPDPIIINIPQDGKLTLQGGPQNLPRTICTDLELSQQLATARKIDQQRKFHQRTIIIRGDWNVKYHQITDVVTICEKTGFRKIALALNPNEKKTANTDSNVTDGNE